MSNQKSFDKKMRQKALNRWENDGGASAQSTYKPVIPFLFYSWQNMRKAFYLPMRHLFNRYYMPVKK